jgi:hypothetical protein
VEEALEMEILQAQVAMAVEEVEQHNQFLVAQDLQIQAVAVAVAVETTILQSAELRVVLEL